MSEKIAISKPGLDVGTVNNPDNLIFSSDYNTLKYAISGTYAMTGTASMVATISHGLGYIPFFACYVNQFDSGVGTLPAVPGGTGQFNMVEYFNLNSPLRAARAYVDANNLYLSFNSGGVPSMTLIWYYKIFKNSLNL